MNPNVSTLLPSRRYVYTKSAIGAVRSGGEATAIGHTSDHPPISELGGDPETEGVLGMECQ